MQKLSVIIPCYCSEHTLKYVIDEAVSVLENNCEYEIIRMNDALPDNTWETRSN